MTASAVKIRKGRKFDQVVSGAREIFLRDGFEGASVDDIARAADVSKATLYSYFPDKKLLFMEVARTQCARQADESLHAIDMTQPPRTVLMQVGHSFLGFILSDMGHRVFRICVAESDRFPELGRAFYDSGPRLVKVAIADYLGAATRRGELAIDDLDLAADQFAELCKADLWAQLIFGIRDTFSAPERDRVVQGAVDTFMARYGA